MTGTELTIVKPAALIEVLGPDVHQLAIVKTNARNDREFVAVWLKAHADGSPATRRLYDLVGRRFIDALKARGTELRRASLEDVQDALEAMKTKADGSPVRPATISTYVAAVKSLLGFAHRARYTGDTVNVATLIKLKRAPRQLAQRLLGELEIRDLVKHANPGRDRLMLQVAYYGALRVSELVSLTWHQVIRRDDGQTQLSIIGKGEKAREVLIPASIAGPLLATRWRFAGERTRVPLRAQSRPSAHRAGGELHREGCGRTRGHQPGGIGALACTCEPYHRQRRAGDAGAGDARPRRFENDQRLRARQAGRELWALPEGSQGQVMEGRPVTEIVAGAR
jgi:integrase